MVCFKRSVLKDKAVWLNVREFAKVHTIDGRAIISVLVADTQAQRVSAPDGEYLSGGALVLYVDCTEGLKPASGQLIDIDGRSYIVREVRELQGVMRRIALISNVS